MSTYAADCRLKVERRTIPGETPEQVLRELRGVVAAAGEQADVRLMFDRPPLVCNRDDSVVNCVRDAVTRVTAREPREIGVAYWMDAAIFAAAGIPTVNYGPAGEGAHAAVEWVDVESVITTARVLLESARRFCG
jgi:acetylornithine deacetylase